MCKKILFLYKAEPFVIEKKLARTSTPSMPETKSRCYTFSQEDYSLFLVQTSFFSAFMNMKCLENSFRLLLGSAPFSEASASLPPEH